MKIPELTYHAVPIPEYKDMESVLVAFVKGCRGCPARIGYALLASVVAMFRMWGLYNFDLAPYLQMDTHAANRIVYAAIFANRFFLPVCETTGIVQRLSETLQESIVSEGKLFPDHDEARFRDSECSTRARVTDGAHPCDLAKIVVLREKLPFWCFFRGDEKVKADLDRMAKLTAEFDRQWKAKYGWCPE